MPRQIPLCAAALALAVVVLSGAAQAATRAALVVGNATYAARPLANPHNDARALARSLSELDFEVALVEDADRQTMARLLEQIPRRLAGTEVGLLYYAGHALSYGGRNYILPVDFELRRPEDLTRTALPVDDLLAAMHEAGAKVVVLILDACRDYPLGQGIEGISSGLARIERAAGEALVAYATAEGTVALDGTGPNSPYTGALVSVLQQPGLSLEAIFREVRGRVREATGGRQLPWVSTSLESEIVLHPKTEPTVAAAAVEPASITLASIHWRTIADSRDPQDFHTFLELQAASPFADQARARLASVEASGRSLIPAIAPAAAAELPQAAGGVRELVTDCDIAASDDEDPSRLTQPVRWGLVNVPLALRVCAIALGRDPGNPRLQFLLGRSLEMARRYEEAEAIYREAIAGGYGAAMVNLGYMHRVGRGRPVDGAEAARLYREAALLGNPRARVNLGSLYRTGQGVPKDLAEAVYWTRLAADVGWANAINALGNYVEKGEGVTQDDAQAAELYVRAAQLGQDDAMNSLGRAYEEGRGVPKDLQQAVAWYERAMALGNPFAPRRLGLLYQRGAEPVVRADPRRARELFLLAADRGYLDAFADVARLHEKGQGVRKDPAQAYYYYLLASLGAAGKGKPEAEKLATTLPAEAAAQQEAAAARWRTENPI